MVGMVEVKRHDDDQEGSYNVDTARSNCGRVSKYIIADVLSTITKEFGERDRFTLQNMASHTGIPKTTIKIIDAWLSEPSQNHLLWNPISSQDNYRHWIYAPYEYGGYHISPYVTTMRSESGTPVLTSTGNGISAKENADNSESSESKPGDDDSNIDELEEIERLDEDFPFDDEDGAYDGSDENS